MVACPSCGAENIDGADVCQHCQQPLDYLTRPRAETPVEKSLMRQTVGSLVHRQPVVTESDTPVRKVLNLMVEGKIGCVLITEYGELAGIFSERDALLRLGVNAAEFGDQPIAAFMTPSPETIEADAELAFALHKMDIGGYRHLPVLESGRIRGVISVRDILRYVTRHLDAPQSAP